MLLISAGHNASYQHTFRAGHVPLACEVSAAPNAASSRNLKGSGLVAVDFEILAL